VCAYAAAKGMETRARVAEVLLGVMALPFIFLIGLAFFDTNFANLQPVFITPPQDLARGILRLGFIFTGLECLLLTSPFIRKGKKMGRHVATALAFAGGIFLLITLLTMAKFGRDVTTQQWPVIRMMDMLNIPGSFIERQEVLMFSFWIITAFTIASAFVFFGGLLVKDIFQTNIKHMGMLVTMAAVFAVSVFPWGEAERVYQALDFMYMTSGVFFMVILPIVLLIAAKFKRSGRSAKRAAAAVGTLLCLVMLTSCWDRVELEDRAFVVAIGIDKSIEGDEFQVSLTIPLNKKGEEDDEGIVKTATAPTITEAMKKLDAKTDKTLYYGQAKLVVLGSELLTDADKTRRAVIALTNNSQIDMRVNVLATSGSAIKVLEAKPPDETLPGLFVADIYRNKYKIGGSSFALDLQRLSASFNNGAIVPMIIIGEDANEIILHGAAAIKNGQKIGSLNREELQGYMWTVSNGNKGAIVTIDINGVLLPVKIEKHNATTGFSYENGLQADLTLKVTAKIQELAGGASSIGEGLDPGRLEQEIATQIAREIFAASDILQKDFRLDGYDWLEVLRQKNYSLYRLYKNEWEDVFHALRIVPTITVEI